MMSRSFDHNTEKVRAIGDVYLCPITPSPSTPT